MSANINNDNSSSFNFSNSSSFPSSNTSNFPNNFDSLNINTQNIYNPFLNNFQNKNKTPAKNIQKKLDLYIQDINDINNWQKKTDYQDKRTLNRQKYLRVQLIYNNRLKNSNLNTNNLNNDFLIEDYINKIKKLYENGTYNAYIANNNYYNFSTCRFCKAPVVFKCEKVICVNKCFETTVANNSFNENYSLDNFMEQYYNYYLHHINCGDKNLITIYIEKATGSAEFLCNKCELNEFIKYLG